MLVGLQVSSAGSYLAPVAVFPVPAHTIRWVPVQTVAWPTRTEGVPDVDVGVQLSVAGS